MADNEEHLEHQGDDKQEKRMEAKMNELKLEDVDKDNRVRNMLNALEDQELIKERLKVASIDQAFKESRIDVGKIKNYLSNKYNVVLG